VMSGLIPSSARVASFMFYAAIVLALSLPARAQTTVRLKPDVQVQAEALARPIRLEQVAAIEGPDADALGAIIVRDREPAGTKAAKPGALWTTLDGPAVRSRLLASPGVNAARVTFSGGKCEIRVLGAARAVTPASTKVAAIDSPSADDGTVRAAIRDRIASSLQVPIDQLRLVFDAGDEELLTLPVRVQGVDRAVEVRVIGTGDRIPISIAIYDGDRLERQSTIRVATEVKRERLRAKSALRRGHVLAESDLEREVAWTPAGSKPVEAGAAVGMVAKGAIAAGRVIEAGDLESPRVVRKGEIVQIDCVSGTLVLKTKARAMSDGVIGDFIKFTALSDKKQIFEARLAAPGRAVVVAGDASQREADETASALDVAQR
jgi:flagella basal body P-ring formation protein FlgA